MNIIAYSSATEDMFGIDRYLSYRHSQDGGINWNIITNHEWKRYKDRNTVVHSTKLRDILVGETPGQNFTWSAASGVSWGGKAI